MIKINMGCGKRYFGSDWTHIDGDRTFEHVDSSDIFLTAFKDDSVDLIYASHFIEYFDRKEVINLLTHWKRVLKPSGILRLAVPNFPILISIYKKTLNLDLILGPLFGNMQMGDKSISHKTTYDYVSLHDILKEIGFNDIKLWNWREVEHGKFDDHSQAYYPHMNKESGILISLNIECKK